MENDPRSEPAKQLLAAGGGISIQARNEFVRVFRPKLRKLWKEVIAALGYLSEFCPKPTPITVEIHERALELAQEYGYRIYNALVIAATLSFSADVLYSEGMQDGHVIEGFTIPNPFRPEGSR